MLGPRYDWPVVGVLEAAATNAVIAVTRYSGAAGYEELGPAVTADSNGVGGACTGGEDGSDYSLELPDAAGPVFVDGSFDGSTDWAAIAFEIPPATGGQGSAGSD